MKLDLGPDAWGSYNTTLHVEHGGYTVSFTGDNAPFEEARKVKRNDGSNGFSTSRDLREIAWLSNAEVMLLATMWDVRPLSKEFDEMVLKRLQDPDWKNLKTVDGGVRRRMSVR